MRNMMLGVVGGILATLVLLAIVRLEPSAVAQRPALGPAENATMLIAHTPTADGGQQLLVIDTEQKVIGSYHVASGSGDIALKAVRSIRYDLLMEEFNGSEPKPRDIRALLEQR